MYVRTALGGTFIPIEELRRERLMKAEQSSMR
jgi:hypothetical protein